MIWFTAGERRLGVDTNNVLTGTVKKKAEEDSLLIEIEKAFPPIKSIMMVVKRRKLYTLDEVIAGSR